jgi:hypothetical protein
MGGLGESRLGCRTCPQLLPTVCAEPGSPSLWLTTAPVVPAHTVRFAWEESRTTGMFLESGHKSRSCLTSTSTWSRRPFTLGRAMVWTSRKDSFACVPNLKCAAGRSANSARTRERDFGTHASQTRRLGDGICFGRVINCTSCNTVIHIHHRKEQSRPDRDPNGNIQRRRPASMNCNRGGHGGRDNSSDTPYGIHQRRQRS